jgi:hypothetical protein
VGEAPNGKHYPKFHICIFPINHLLASSRGQHHWTIIIVATTQQRRQRMGARQTTDGLNPWFLYRRNRSLRNNSSAPRQNRYGRHYSHKRFRRSASVSFVAVLAHRAQKTFKTLRGKSPVSGTSWSFGQPISRPWTLVTRTERLRKKRRSSVLHKHIPICFGGWIEKQIKNQGWLYW